MKRKIILFAIALLLCGCKNVNLPSSSIKIENDSSEINPSSEEVLSSEDISSSEEETLPYTIVDDYVYFGYYPQSVKEASVSITGNYSENIYIGSDDCYYVSATALPWNSNIVFSNGEQVVNGETYYFKIEPIKWKILKTDENGNYVIQTSTIIDVSIFCKTKEDRYIDGDLVHPNNYKHSIVRKWINEDFYNNSFSSLQKEYILETLVDNSPETTGEKNNQYCCENTTDKLFLLSFNQLSEEYQLDNSNSRLKYASDYALALGCLVVNGYGCYFLRSPSNINSFYAQVLSYSGSIFLTLYVDEKYGIAPVLTLKAL